MAKEIGFADITLEYLSIAEAREKSGLRLVLGAYAVPGPWREACKCLFDVKRVPYASVVNSNPGASDIDLGMGGGRQSELIAWAAQSSSPVAIWNDERPRSLWIDQLNLAERLEPEPRLIPQGIEQRMKMFAWINEIAGENGFGWSRRLILVKEGFERVLRSINALYLNCTEYHQVIKASSTCASTQCWPKLRRSADTNSVFPCDFSTVSKFETIATLPPLRCCSHCSRG